MAFVLVGIIRAQMECFLTVNTECTPFNSMDLNELLTRTGVYYAKIMLIRMCKRSYGLHSPHIREFRVM